MKSLTEIIEMIPPAIFKAGAQNKQDFTLPSKNYATLDNILKEFIRLYNFVNDKISVLQLNPHHFEGVEIDADFDPLYYDKEDMVLEVLANSMLSNFEYYEISKAFQLLNNFFPHAYEFQLFSNYLLQNKSRDSIDVQIEKLELKIRQEEVPDRESKEELVIARILEEVIAYIRVGKAVADERGLLGDAVKIFRKDVKAQIDRVSAKPKSKSINKNSNRTLKMTILNEVLDAIIAYENNPKEKANDEILMNKLSGLYQRVAAIPHVGPRNTLFGGSSRTTSLLNSFIEKSANIANDAKSKHINTPKYHRK
jgi:hypothetical protein